MRELGLVACQILWRPATTTVQGQAGPIPDLTNRDITAEIPGQKIVGDPYSQSWEGWAGLSISGNRPARTGHRCAAVRGGVNGQDHFPVGGHLISALADS